MVQNLNVDLGGRGRVLAVERPGDILFRAEGDLFGVTHDDVLGIELLMQQRHQQTRKIFERADEGNENEFKLAVVHGNDALRELQLAADAGAVADCAEEIVPLKHLTVGFDLHVIGVKGIEILGTFENIGEVAKSVLDFLGSGVGCAGERTEGCDVNELAVIELTEIQRVRLTGEELLRCFLHLQRKTEAQGKIVGAAAGKVADGGAGSGQLHDTADGAAEGAVTAAADDEIVLVTKFGGNAGDVTVKLRLADGDQISGFGKGPNRIKEGGRVFAASGFGVGNQEKLLIHEKDSFCHWWQTGYVALGKVPSYIGWINPR